MMDVLFSFVRRKRYFNGLQSALYIVVGGCECFGARLEGQKFAMLSLISTQVQSCGVSKKISVRRLCKNDFVCYLVRFSYLLRNVTCK